MRSAELIKAFMQSTDELADISKHLKDINDLIYFNNLLNHVNKLNRQISENIAVRDYLDMSIFNKSYQSFYQDIHARKEKQLSELIINDTDNLSAQFFELLDILQARLLQNSTADYKLQLIGAYAISKELSDLTPYADSRKTKDLDFNIHTYLDLNKVSLQLEEIVRSILPVETFKTTIRDKSISFKISIMGLRDKLKIDFGLSDSDINTKVKPILDSFYTKLNLALTITDRRFKDVCDVILILQNLPNNMLPTKSDILSHIDSSLVSNWLSADVLDSSHQQASQFKYETFFKNATNDDKQRFVFSMKLFLKGLIDSNVVPSSVFRYNRWD